MGYFDANFMMKSGEEFSCLKDVGRVLEENLSISFDYKNREFDIFEVYKQNADITRLNFRIAMNKLENQAFYVTIPDG